MTAKKKAGKKPAKTPQGSSMLRESLPWVGGLVLILVIGLVLIANLLLIQAPHANQQKMVAQLVRQQSALIKVTLQQYKANVATMANSPQVNNALQDPSSAKILAKQLSQLRAPAKVYLISDKDSLTAAGLSYLNRSSLNKAAAGKPVIELTAGKQSELLMVYRSQNGAGSILVEQPLKALWQEVQKLVPQGGAIKVSQGSLTLVQAGKSSADIHSEVKTPLGINVATSLPQPSTVTQQPLFLIIAVSMIVLVVLLIWLLIKRLQSLLYKDVDLLSKQIQRMARGNKAEAEPKLVVMQDLSGSLKAVIKRMGGTNGAGNAKAKPAAQKVDRPDAFTDILVEEDMGMLVDQDKKEAASAASALPEEIFRAYDIRGKVGETLTKETVELIGRAIGSEAMDAGQQTVLVARDGRLSGPELNAALIKGLQASGRDVVDLGAVPTPVLYYATKVLDSQTGVCLTGSHNPAEYNGLKIVIDGEALYGERIQALRQRIAQGNFSEGQGSLDTRDISERYLNDILDDIVLARPLKVVVDSGNGITGNLAPKLMQQLGCEVTELYCDVDGNFPNHHPDPSKESNLADLIKAVQQAQADIGLAFDGDGDRLGIVTASGQIIWSDRLLMLFAQDVLSRSPGVDIIFDVKCTRALPALIRRLGGRPMMWKTGHSFIKARLKEVGAPLAGEMSGHIFFADRWFGVDDGLYAAARLLEILSLADQDSDQVFAQFKTGKATPELSVKTTEDAKFRIIKQLAAQSDKFGGSVSKIDGLRVDFPDGWGLVRASNTTPLLIARFEGRDDAALERIKQLFHKNLAAVDEKLELPF